MHWLSKDELSAIYGTPAPAALRKVADHVTPEYARLIAASRFCVLATDGPHGVDASPRGDDGPVARSQGIPPATMFPMAFAIATGLAGLTGALVTPMLALDPHVGEGVLLKAFVVVILGGMGSIPGAMLAAFIVGLIEAYASVYLGGSKGALVLFVLVLVILLVRPQGIFGTEARKA